MGDFSKLSSRFLKQNNTNTIIPQASQPTTDEEWNLHKEAIQSRLVAQDSGLDIDLNAAERQYTGPQWSQGDILMGGAEKAGRSLIAGTGNVLDGIIDIFEFGVSQIPGQTPMIVHEEIFKPLRESISAPLQNMGVKYGRGFEWSEFQWKDMGRADFWSTDIVEALPMLISSVYGGVGLSKLAGKGMTSLGKRYLSKSALASNVVRSGNVIGNVGGKGIGKFFVRQADDIALSRAGQGVAGFAGGVSQNAVFSAMNAGEAYNRALEEFKGQPDMQEKASAVAADVFSDGMKWSVINGLSFAYTYGGLSKMAMSKFGNLAKSANDSFGQRVTNIAVNASAGTILGASVAGAATFGEEGMGDAMLKGAATGAVTMSLMPGRRGVRIAGAAGVEMIEEPFQEVYEEWVKVKALNDARGESDKTPSYWDFYKSSENKKVKAISMVMGGLGGVAGGFTNVINDIAEQSYEDQQRLDALTDIVNRGMSDNHQEKTEAAFDMVIHSVANGNEEALSQWLSDERAKPDGAIDEGLYTELTTFMDEQKSAYEKIGLGMEHITAQEKSRLFKLQAGVAKNTAEADYQTDIYQEQRQAIEDEANKVAKSNMSDEAKKEAISNLQESLDALDAKYANFQNRVEEAQTELQDHINKYTSQLHKNSKARASKKTPAAIALDALKSLASAPKQISDFVAGIRSGLRTAREKASENQEQEPDLREELFKAVMNDVKNQEFYDAELYSDAAIQEVYGEIMKDHDFAQDLINAKTEEDGDKVLTDLVEGLIESLRNMTEETVVQEAQNKPTASTEDNSEKKAGLWDKLANKASEAVEAVKKPFKKAEEEAKKGVEKIKQTSKRPEDMTDEELFEGAPKADSMSDEELDAKEKESTKKRDESIDSLKSRKSSGKEGSRSNKGQVSEDITEDAEIVDEGDDEQQASSSDKENPYDSSLTQAATPSAADDDTSEQTDSDKQTATPIGQDEKTDKSFDDEISLLEEQLAEAKNDGDLKLQSRIMREIDRLKISKMRSSKRRKNSKSTELKTDAESVKSAKQESKKESSERKKKNKRKWYSPLRILDGIKARKARKAKIKEALKKASEHRKENSIHRVYALRDAGMSTQGVVTISDISTIFGEDGYSAAESGVIYASLQPEFAKNIKHEMGHMLYESIVDSDLWDEMKNILLKDKKALRDIAKAYPELILFDTPSAKGAMDVEDMVMDSEIYAMLISESKQIKKAAQALRKALISKEDSLKQAEELASLLSSKKSQIVSVAPMEHQEHLLEEAFAHYLESDDIKMRQIFSSEPSTDKKLTRKANIFFNRLKTPKMTEEKAQDMYNKTNGVNEEIQDILPKIAKKFEEANNVRPSLRSRGRRLRKASQKKAPLNPFATTSQALHSVAYENQELVSYISSKYGVIADDYVSYMSDAIKNSKGKSSEEIIEAIIEEAEIFMHEINANNKASTGEVVFHRDTEGRLFNSEIESVAGFFLSKMLMNGDNELANAVKNSGLDLNRDEESQFDNINFEASSVSNIIEAYSKFFVNLKSEDDFALLDDFYPKRSQRTAPRLKQAMKRALFNASRSAGSPEALSNMMLNPRTKELKLMKIFLERLYFNEVSVAYGQSSFISEVAKSVFFEMSTNVSESRESFIYNQKTGEGTFEHAYSNDEQALIESLTSSYDKKERKLTPFDRKSFFFTPKSINELNEFGQSKKTLLDMIYGLSHSQGEIAHHEWQKEMIDYKSLNSVTSISVNGSVYSLNEIASRLADDSINHFDVMEGIAHSLVRASRAMNQTTMVDMAKHEAKTNLTNKTSALFENHKKAVDAISTIEGRAKASKKELEAYNNSAMSYMMNELAINPEIIAISGVKEANNERVSSSYMRMSPDEVVLMDIMKYFSSDSKVYDSSFIESEKSRRYSVTSPKIDINTDSKALNELARRAADATYGDGSRVTSLFIKGDDKPSLKSRVDSVELDRQVTFVLNAINSNPRIKKSLGDISDADIENFVVSNALNRFSNQEILVSAHIDRKNVVDYNKRQAMAIARRRQLFDAVEVVILPRMYQSSNLERDNWLISEDELHALAEKEGVSVDELKKEFKDADDAASYMTELSERVMHERAGIAANLGKSRTYKTVYSGRGGKAEGDLYLKHNTSLVSADRIESTLDSGNLYALKLKAFMEQREAHLYEKTGRHVAVIAMPQSAVKSSLDMKIAEGEGKSLNVVDVRNIKFTDDMLLDAVSTVEAREKIQEALSNRSLAEDKGVSLSKFNEERTKDLSDINNGVETYVGFEASNFGLQSVIWSEKNKTTSNTGIQVPDTAAQIPSSMQQDFFELMSAHNAATRFAAAENLYDIKRDKGKDTLNEEWAGAPEAFLADNGYINLPGVQTKIQKVISKRMVTKGTKLRGPGGIGLQAAPYGVRLASRVEAGALKSKYDKTEGGFTIHDLTNDSIVSEIQLPASSRANFRHGDVVTVTRVPADKLAMTQVFVVKGFYGENSGQIFSISPDISSILGSDLDGDALYMNGVWRGLSEKSSRSKQAYNNYITKLIEFMSDPEIKHLTGLSLEGVDNEADAMLAELGKSVKTDMDITSMEYVRHALQNNIEVKSILGEAILALRDTTYLSLHNVKLAGGGSIFINGRKYNQFNNNDQGSDVQLVSNIVQLILDNASHQKVFSIGVNNTVIKDMIILAKMGVPQADILGFINNEDVVRKYEFDSTNNIVSGIDSDSRMHDPGFLAWMSNKYKLSVGATLEWVGNPENAKALSVKSQDYYVEVKPAFVTGQGSYKMSTFATLRVLQMIKQDTAALGDILSVHKTVPNSELEIEMKIENLKDMAASPLVLDPESVERLMESPTIKNRIESLRYLLSALFETTSLVNRNSFKVNKGFARIFDTGKAYKARAISEELENMMFDKAAKDIFPEMTDGDATYISLLSSVEDRATAVDLTSPLRSILSFNEGKLSVKSDALSRATDNESIAEIASIIEEELSDNGKIAEITYKNADGKEATIDVFTAMLALKYHQESGDSGKSRLRYDAPLLSVMPKSVLTKVNDAFNSEVMEKGVSKISVKTIKTIARAHTNKISTLNNTEFVEYGKKGNSDILVHQDGKIQSINHSKLNRGNVNIVSALYERTPGKAQYVFSEEKLESLIKSGINAIPYKAYSDVGVELYYINLKSIHEGGEPSTWVFKDEDYNGRPPGGGQDKKSEEIDNDSKKDSSSDSARGIAGTSTRKGTRLRKNISINTLNSFNPEMNLEQYAEKLGIRKSMLKNPDLKLGLEKEHGKLKNSKTFISQMTKIVQEMEGESIDDLMQLAHDISSTSEIEKLGKDALLKEVSILIARKARADQMSLNPEGYAEADGGDISFMKKWLMSNDVDMNNPDVQAMTRIIEQEYFNFTQEYAKEARPIKKIAKDLRKDFMKKVGFLEYAKLWLKGELNKEVYKNIYSTRKDERGAEFIVLKFDTRGLTPNEKAFHAEFTRVMTIADEGFTGDIPYNSMNYSQAMSQHGLFGLYMTSEGQSSHLNKVKVYGKDPIDGREILKTFEEWKQLYAHPHVSKSKWSTLQSFRDIKKRAEAISKSGMNEDGTPIEFGDNGLRNMIGISRPSSFVNQDGVSLKEFASYDLESAALTALKSSIFMKGRGKFTGFGKLGFLIDGIIEYNEDNPNLREWVQEIYKEYMANPGKKPKASKLGRAADAFVLFTTLKVLGPWNLGIPLGNLAIGKYQALRATGMKQFLKGEARFLNPGNFRKNAAILRNYVAFDMSMYEDFYTNKEKTPFNKMADLIMLPMEQSEKYIQGAAFLSYLTEEEYDNISVDENGHIQFKDESLALDSQRVAELMEDVRKEQGKGYNVTNRRLTGMYASTRLLFQFKKYLPTLVVERFGKDRVNRFGQSQIGSITAVKETIRKYYKGEITYEELSQQPEHISDGIRKWRNGVFLSMAIFALANFDDDEGWMDELGSDTMAIYNPERWSYRLQPATYWSLKSMID